MEITVDLKPINVGQLDGDVRAAFPNHYKGLSTDQKSIRFFVDDDLTEADVKAIQAIYEAHVPTETDEQASERKRTAKKELRQALKDFDKAKIQKMADLLPYFEALIRLAVDD